MKLIFPLTLPKSTTNKNTKNTDAEIYDGSVIAIFMMLITTPIESVTIDINNNNSNYDTLIVIF